LITSFISCEGDNPPSDCDIEKHGNIDTNYLFNKKWFRPVDPQNISAGNHGYVGEGYYMIKSDSASGYIAAFVCRYGTDTCIFTGFDTTNHFDFDSNNPNRWHVGDHSYTTKDSYWNITLVSMNEFSYRLDNGCFKNFSATDKTFIDTSTGKIY
jgi:hypothetical protein